MSRGKRAKVNVGRFFIPRVKIEKGSGQAIVLIALGAVGMLAFTALAIDGGSLLFLQRDAQNAVDAAVTAAILAKARANGSVRRSQWSAVVIFSRRSSRSSTSRATWISV